MQVTIALVPLNTTFDGVIATSDGIIASHLLQTYQAGFDLDIVVIEGALSFENKSRGSHQTRGRQVTEALTEYSLLNQVHVTLNIYAQGVSNRERMVGRNLK